jgi:2-C-methyl-D-erythritol 4-phosphate cytidylyltransferase/2-C-methyl-D-erythritol 4-phosphate cytidylyltransferase/2-C-methyl-D-erythritol 2,4-cyclodiphosphate synthase
MPDILVLTAAGSSTRMGGDKKKEYLTISQDGDERVSVLSSALYAFLETGLFPIIVITVPQAGEAETRAVLAEDSRIAKSLANQKIELRFAEGGASRQESVMNGLKEAERILKQTDRAQPSEAIDDIVLIHDGARPWVSGKMIADVIANVRAHGAAVPGTPSVDTQKEIDDTGKIIRHLDRSRIVSVQTPQGFFFGELLEAHRKAALDGRTYTDDTEIWGRYAGDVYVCPGERENRKITWPGDL